MADISYFATKRNTTEDAEYTMKKSKTQKSRPNFSKKTTSVLMNWLSEHIHHPWPTKQEKKELCRLSGLTPKQLRIWFTNNRKRKLNSLAKEQSHGMQDSLPVDASLNNMHQSIGGQMFMAQGDMGHMGMQSAYSHAYPPMMEMVHPNLNSQMEVNMNAMTNYCM